MNLTLRPATPDDEAILLHWRNDLHARAMFHDSAEVDAATHAKWFARVVWNERHVLLIGEVDGVPVGAVRYDRVKDHWEVSVNVAPEARGRGMGTALLRQGAAHVSGRVVARIKPNNAASLRAFAYAGYVVESESVAEVVMSAGM